jgi:XTP/dITP diphosphohydrolase
VLASNNAKKLAELQACWRRWRDAGAQGELGIGEADEPHRTFVENALAKARHAAAASGCRRWPTTPACASTRWAAHPAWSAHFAAIDATRRGPARPPLPQGRANNNARLLERLAGIADRRATSSAPWWRCATPTTPSRWSPSAAGPGEILPRRAAATASATTR